MMKQVVFVCKKMNLIIGCYLIALFFLSCESDNAKQFSLEELEQNENNQLQLPVPPKPELKKLCEQLREMEKEAVISFLEKKGLNLFEASYGFHFLGNRYFAEDEFDKGLHYQYVAADQYLNPLAELRIAQIYFQPTAKIKSTLPAGQGKDFEQNLSKAYHYLHLALNHGVLTMNEFGDRTATDDVNIYASPLIEVFQKKDSTVLGDFDVEAAAAKMKAHLPEMEEEFNRVYAKEKEG